MKRDYDTSVESKCNGQRSIRLKEFDSSAKIVKVVYFSF
jgi:hypothetical protein